MRVSPLKIIILGVVFALITFQNANASDDLLLKISDKNKSVSYDQFSQWIENKTYLERAADQKSTIENIYYCPVAKIICFISTTEKDKLSTIKKNDISYEKEEIEKFVYSLEKEFNKDPIDAAFSVEDGVVSSFALSQDGIKIKSEEAINTLSEEIVKIIKENKKNAEIEIGYELIKPSIKSEDINKLGIVKLIGEGRSNFKGSTLSRIHNIKVATSRFQGVLIKPGEEFSFVNRLGEVDGEHGYKEELVIKKDKTEPEFGGGICQVSTTTFRAAIYSGLDIIYRRNHAYPVQYYSPQGMDATVYLPWPDLKFKNNTPGYILIQTKIVGTELIFQFYGTDDGRKVEILGPYITERKPDGSMKAYFTQKVFNKYNNLVKEETFKSDYDSPSKYPHPSTNSGLITEKPKNWSSNEWDKYKKEHGI